MMNNKRFTEMNDVIKTIRSHRSIRKFQQRPIDEDILIGLIETGQAAASSSFVQACSVIRVTDKNHRKQIAEAAGGQQWVIDAPEFLVFCADLNRIDLACQKQDLGRLEGYTEHFIVATVDVALLAQNVLLAAESMGLGGVFIGGIRNDPQLLCDLLALPDQVYPAFGMCLGWPDVDPDIKPRFPVQSILHQGVYQNDNIEQDIKNYDELMKDYYKSRSGSTRLSNWSTQTANAMQLKKREHMLTFLNKRGLLKR